MERDNVAEMGVEDEHWSHSDGRSGAAGRGSRGQTTLDFAIGMSVFLAVVMFVFLFVPGILEPFTVGAQDETVTTNRVADDLTQDALGNATEPNVLATHCVLVFFEAARNGDDVTACGFDGESLQEFVGVSDRQNVNVSVRGNVTATDRTTELLCWDDDEAELLERDGDGPPGTSCNPGGDDVLLAAGGAAPTDNDDSVTATRVAWLEAEDVTLRVEMW